MITEEIRTVSESDLKKGDKNIYNQLGATELGLEPAKVFCYRSANKKSIGFKMDVSGAVAERFKEIFDLENYNYADFKEKLAQSISGDGQELSKINALHSSSLCALLMFYNVSDKKPFSIDGHTFTNSFFEVKNKVIKSPSNMDVVLTNEATKEILFVECKFSEYLSKSEKYDLPKDYKEYKDKGYFGDIDFEKETVFPYGLKQLVAHYIGIDYFRKEEYSPEQLFAFYPNEDDFLRRKTIYDNQMKYEKIYFMEVVFQLDVGEYGTYIEETEKVFDALRKIEEGATNKPIEIIGTKTYQELFRDNKENLKILPDKVKMFYFKNELNRWCGFLYAFMKRTTKGD